MRISGRAVVCSLAGLVILGAAGFFATSKDSAQPPEAKPSAPSSKRSRSALTKATHSIPQKTGRRLFADLTDPGWQQNAAKLTPHQAKQMLERDRLEEKNLDVRAQRAWNIISQLCLNGYPNEAWELIETSPGAVREKALGGFFRDAKLPEAELIAMMNGLNNGERSSAYYNYWCRFSAQEFAALDLTQFPMRNPVEFGAFRQTLENMLTESYDPKDPQAHQSERYDLLFFAVQQANLGSIKYGEISNLLQKDPSKDGFTYWEAMKSASPELRATQTNGEANYRGPDSMVIRAMTIQDPEKTMAMTLVPDSHEANYIHIAMCQWLEKDFTSAQAWYDSHEASFTPDQRERAAVAFVRAQTARGEYESALQWHQLITSPRWLGAIKSNSEEIRRNTRKPPADNSSNSGQ